MKINRTLAHSSESMPLWEEMLPTPLCPLWLSFSERGLQALYFNNPGTQTGPLWPVDQHQSDPELATSLRQWRQETTAALMAYFAGRPDSFEHLSLDLQGTPFQIRVWEALRQVPFGRFSGYAPERPGRGRRLGSQPVADYYPLSPSGGHQWFFGRVQRRNPIQKAAALP
jgi:hypothetical protein